MNIWGVSRGLGSHLVLLAQASLLAIGEYPVPVGNLRPCDREESEPVPSWWFEATLATVAFSALFVVWVALPPRLGEEDLASRMREWIARHLARSQP